MWIIEKRTPEGKLDLSGPQPETVFGLKAITGITDDEIAKAIYRHPKTPPCLALDGRCIEQWPSALDPRWVARRKTW